MPLPPNGWSTEDVLAALEDFKGDDIDFARGRSFGLVYPADNPEFEKAVEAAHLSYLWHNALNPAATPSLARLQQEVIEISVELLGGAEIDDEPAGFMTSGGTESLLLAVKAATVRARRDRGVDHPNVVVAMSAHAAFDKAADYFGLECRRVAVGPDWRADVDGMASAVDGQTALMVGSAPQFPQGVIDPIGALASIAAERGVSFHVDACLGGFVLPFLERAGHPVPPWDFRVPGVTSISADIHKYGYVPKGASVLVHRTKALRRDQTFVSDRWLGGRYGTPGIPGARPGGPIAAAWAALHLLGEEGMTRLAVASVRAREALVALMGEAGLRALGTPDVMAAAFTSDALDVFAVGDELARRGWHLDRQSPPDSLHASCAPVHLRVMDEFAADLHAAVAAIGTTRARDRATTYAAPDIQNPV